MPGSALRLLNQGRAQGLFTPSTSGLSALAQGRPSGFASPGPHQTAGYSQSPRPQSSETPPPTANLKRHRSEADVETLSGVHPGNLSRLPSDTLVDPKFACRFLPTGSFKTAVC